MGNEFDDYGQKRRNAEECERAGSVLRTALGGGADDRMPSLIEMFQNARKNVPEANSLDIVIRSDEAMGDDRAFAVPDEQDIYVGLAFHDEISRDSPEARFDGIHELMHIVFHRGAPRFFRKAGGNVLYAFLHDQHEQAEWQADRITRAVFMPAAMVASCDNALQLSKAAGVPLRQAVERIKELAKREPRATPDDILIKLAELARDGSASSAELRRRQAELLKMQLWSELPAVEGEDKATVRKCGSYQIFWNEFGKTTQCGWFIENGHIVSHFSLRMR
jgi:Zn-dependent peptidase ImmA (M78 family)